MAMAWSRRTIREARCLAFYGSKRFENSGGGEHLIDDCLGELNAFAGRNWEQEDDITLVTLQRSASMVIASEIPS
jgi:hypothetical protein